MFKWNLQSHFRTAAAFALMATSSAWAVDVKVEGVHLCCGNCVRAAARSLDVVDGVSKISVNKDEEFVTFIAKDDLYNKRGELVAAAGASCANVLPLSLPWLLKRGHIVARQVEGAAGEGGEDTMESIGDADFSDATPVTLHGTETVAGPAARRGRKGK